MINPVSCARDCFRLIREQAMVSLIVDITTIRFLKNLGQMPKPWPRNIQVIAVMMHASMASIDFIYALFNRLIESDALLL